jgi:hypothetical protein
MCDSAKWALVFLWGVDEEQPYPFTAATDGVTVYNPFNDACIETLLAKGWLPEERQQG